MSIGGNRKDRDRLKAIVKTLVGPFMELEHLKTEDKFYMAMNPEGRPIYRRKILKPMKVYGLWWLYESQWTRFLSPVHGNAHVIKSGEDPDRVLASRTMGSPPGGWCYIRERDDKIDLEALCKVERWDPEKKKKTTGTEWLTVSITKAAFIELDGFFGPVHSGCRH